MQILGNLQIFSIYQDKSVYTIFNVGSMYQDNLIFHIDVRWNELRVKLEWQELSYTQGMSESFIRFIFTFQDKFEKSHIHYFLSKR